MLKPIILVSFLSGVFILTLIPVLTYVVFAQDLQNKQRIMNYNDSGLTLLDRQGEPFFDFYQAKNKTFVPLSRVPVNLQQAVIASEDNDFYKHNGFSIRAILRSLYLNLQNRALDYGGSTITQQLVKNALLKPTKSFLRKYQEFVLAQEIERRYSKKEILEMYLNSVYFGEGAFGVEGAAQTYFDKTVADLNLVESSLLVGLLPSPSKLSPLSGNVTEAKKHQKLVLQKMQEAGYISSLTRKQTETTPLVFNSKREINTIAPHFALMVKDELIQRYGEEQIIRSGFKVKTTLDSDWQRYAEKVVEDQVERLRVNNVSNGAAVVIDPKTGEIKVLVGSHSWYDGKYGKFNIINSLRQPGSAFKPIVYSAAFEERLITPASILQDRPTSYLIDRYSNEVYRPRDYDGKFRGSVTVRRALANSLNIPAVEVLSKLGVGEALDMAERLGITTLKDRSRFGLSLVLGAGEVKPLELTNVYAVFANHGQQNTPTSILEITDKFNQQIYSYKPNPNPVLSPEVTFLISSILSDNRIRTEVFGSALDISRPAAVKTGTTENFRDAWALGYTPSLVVGVWVGNNDGASMDNIAGSLGAAPIWASLMEKYLEGTPVETFLPPEGIVSNVSCIGNRVNASEYFIRGTEPRNLCSNPTATSTDTITPSSSPESPTISISPTQFVIPTISFPTGFPFQNSRIYDKHLRELQETIKPLNKHRY